MTDFSSMLLTATGLFSINPPVFFFLLGVAAALVRSNLAIPKSATQVLSLYLLWAIGFRGGVELVESGFTSDALKAIALGAGLALILPVWAYAALRRFVDCRNAAAIAACYGSVSVVTFVTACAAFDQSGTPYSGHMVAVMALMESPAIVVSLILLNLDQGRPGEKPEIEAPPGESAGNRRAGLRPGVLLHESLMNGPVLLLLGSIEIGLLTGQAGYAAFKPLCTDAFPALLAFFLLDLGLLAARRAREVYGAPRLLLFALVAPLVNATLALAAAKALRIGEGDAILLAVLAASASYIAAPAALRLALPRAEPSIYISLALGVTFPFNIVLGIPLYTQLVRWWW